MSLPRRLSALSVVAAIALIGTTGCQSVPSTLERATVDPAITRPAQVAPAAPATADDAINKVLAISVDALNPTAILALGPSGAPNFYRMMRQGAFTLNARTEYEQTITLPNHTGMLTSRRIDRKKHGHGVTVNYDNGKTVHQMAHHYVASVFDVVHDRGGSTAMYAAKTKFKVFSRTWNTHGRKDKVGKNDGRRKIDTVVINENDDQLVAALNRQLATSAKTFTFLHIKLPDEAGHAYGFMGPQYLAAVQHTDRLLGTILDTINARPALKSQLLVALTADHGGAKGKSHSDATKLYNYRIPFIAWGPRVPAGTDLYAMNPRFADPGTKRPTYAGKQPIRNGDIANLSTDVLDLPTVPGSRLDRPRYLTVVR